MDILFGIYKWQAKKSLVESTANRLKIDLKMDFLYKEKETLIKDELKRMGYPEFVAKKINRDKILLLSDTTTSNLVSGIYGVGQTQLGTLNLFKRKAFYC